MEPNSKQIKIGNYILGNTIGKGNSAVVKIAIHSMTKQKVAIKIFDKSVLDNEKQLRLKREIDSMKQLKKHPNIIKLYEIMETNKLICLVTEYACNGELYDLIIHKKRLSEREAKHIFRQIVSAVYYCHSNKIVHRDLKVENLLLDSNETIKLADFGFSSTFKLGELLDIYCGSPPYCAPELFLAKKYDGTKVDIWSLGVILYVIVCGYLPFEASQFTLLRSQVVCGNYKLPFFLSEDCKNLINRMLNVNPEKRISLNEIINSKWLNSEKSSNENDFSYNSKEFTHLINQIESISIEDNTPSEEVLSILSKRYDLNLNKVIESIVNNEFDSLSGLYYLTEANLIEKKNQAAPEILKYRFEEKGCLNIVPDASRTNRCSKTKSKFKNSLLKYENNDDSSEKIDINENVIPIEELGRDYLARYSGIRRHTIASNTETINEENSFQNLQQIVEIGQSLNSNYNLPNISSENFNIDHDYQTIHFDHNPRKHSYHKDFFQNKCIKSKHDSNAKNDNDFKFEKKFLNPPPIINSGRRASDGGSNICLFNHLYNLKYEFCHNTIISSNSTLDSEKDKSNSFKNKIDILKSEPESFNRKSRGSITSGTPISNLINISSDEDEISNDVNNNHLPSSSMKFQKRPSFSKGSRHEPYYKLGQLFNV